MEWTKKDLGQDTINQILPINFKLFLKKHHKKYLKNMNEYQEVNRKCYVLINAGYFIIAKSAGIDGTTFKTMWRTNATEKNWLEFVKTSGRKDYSRRPDDLAGGFLWVRVTSPPKSKTQDQKMPKVFA